MNMYKIEVKHDKSTITITTRGQTIEEAINKVMSSENCPRSAIGSWLKVPTKKQLARTKSLIQGL